MSNSTDDQKGNSMCLAGQAILQFLSMGEVVSGYSVKYVSKRNDLQCYSL